MTKVKVVGWWFVCSELCQSPRQRNHKVRCVCLGRSSFTTKDMREGDDVNQGSFCIFHPRSNLDGFISFVVSRSTVAGGT